MPLWWGHVAVRCTCLLALALAGCAAPIPTHGPMPERWPDPAAWTSATPEQAGMDPAKLAEAIGYGRARGGSGLVTRGGLVVGQWGDQAAKHDLKSTTKSFGSILLGVAIRDRRVDLETRLLPALSVELASQEPREQAAGWLPRLTVRHLATHTGGFAKVGGFSPMLFAPGTGWFYSDAGPNWLADLLTVTYGRDLRSMLDERVLRPMGIAADRVVWRTNRYRPAILRGIPRRELGSGISTDVDVMARMGLMLLRGGRWRTAPILPPDYPDLAGAPAPGLGDLRCAGPRGMCPGANRHYGLLFWNNADGFMAAVPKDAYWSAGLGTSFILVIPSLDIVAARAGPRWPSPGRPGTWATEPFFALLTAAVVK